MVLPQAGIGKNSLSPGDRMLLFIIRHHAIKDYKRGRQNSICEVFHQTFWNTRGTFDLTFGFQAYAADLSAALNPETDISDPSYIGVRTLTLQYPAGSSLAQELDGQNRRIEFSLNSTTTGQNDTGMSGLVTALNRAFVQAESPVQASQAFVSYSGVLRGGPTSTVISYRVD